MAHTCALEKRSSRGRELRLKSEFVRRYVVLGLKAGYSPEQIATKLQSEHPNESISHEAIYQYIYSQSYRDKDEYAEPEYDDLREYLKRKPNRRQKKGMGKSSK